MTEISGVFLCADMLIEIVEYLRIPEYYAFIRTCKDIYAMRSKFHIKDYVNLHYKKEKSAVLTNKTSAVIINKSEYYDHIIKNIDKNLIKKLYLYLTYKPITNIYITKRDRMYQYIFINGFINLQYLKCYSNNKDFPNKICINQTINIVKLGNCSFRLDENCKIIYLKLKNICHSVNNENHVYYIKNLIYGNPSDIEGDELYIDNLYEGGNLYNILSMPSENYGNTIYKKLFYNYKYKIKTIPDSICIQEFIYEYTDIVERILYKSNIIKLLGEKICDYLIMIYKEKNNDYSIKIL